MYKDASIFLFPSHEGAGMVVAEALSFGLPVVCLDNCGPGEFITDQCGIAVKIQDHQTTINSLSEAITSLFLDKELHSNMSREARKRFKNYFHWDRRGEQLNEIYKKYWDSSNYKTFFKSNIFCRSKN
jgi:glycosyltransferase involved in cell wall biosynthesis